MNTIKQVMISETMIDAAVREMFGSITFPAEPAGLYDPLRYMISIGGKRLRPRLCLTSYALFRDTIPEDIVEPVRALEVYHSFTLIHDDIMDKSPLRRGCETVWKKWNPDIAILSGDVMLADAFRRAASAPMNVREKALALFTRTAAEVCEGQQYDMDFESAEEVSMSEYGKMIGLKTAALLACSSGMGAVLADAPDAACKALYDYGWNIGMAFQVQDDYLDAFGDEKVFGKPIGGDIVNSKKSWLTVRAAEKASDKGAFLEAFSAPAGTAEEQAAKISAVRKFYLDLGVDKDAVSAIKDYSDKAMGAVEGIGLGQVRLESLKRFAAALIGRAK